MRIHQIGPVLCAGDAVTNQILEIDDCLAQWGFATSIYGSDITCAPPGRTQPDSAYGPYLDSSDDLLIYHYSAYCDNYKLFVESRNRKVLIYHNITPPQYYAPYDAQYHSLCVLGRQILPHLSACDLALGVSDYNRQELVEAGFARERTSILPLLLSAATSPNTPRRESLYGELKEKGCTNILFVGRVAPNKAFEDLIKIFYAYQRYVDDSAHLYLVGARFLPTYDRALDTLVCRLGLAGSVIFTDRVPPTDLRSYYEAADIFLCASLHEGFCAPLLEAMYYDVPIVARATTAVPETLGQAGILYRTLSAPIVAEAIQLLMSDRELRARVIARQRSRLADFSPSRVRSTLRSVLESVIGPIGIRE